MQTSLNYSIIVKKQAFVCAFYRPKIFHISHRVRILKLKYRVSIALLCIASVIAVSVFSVRSRQYPSHTVSADRTALPTVIIDPGHGGFDGGAVAADGTVEKDINLKIALKLDAVLRAVGFNTVLTRCTDVSLNLSDSMGKSAKVDDMVNRAAFMKKYPESVFISLHMNKYTSSQPHGAQVFYSSVDGSAVLAESIQSAIALHVQPDNNRQIKQTTSDIYLLYRATVPAVLTECGFLSNAEELEKLKDDDYLLKIAVSVAYGILNYYSENKF